jgi:integrase
MTTREYNLDIGTLKLKKRGKKGTFHLFISFHDLGTDNRYRASTGTNQIKLAEPKAIAMVQSEYKRRKAGIHLDRKTTPQRYLTQTHIPWLMEQVGLPLDNKPNLSFTKRKVKNDTDILMRHFHKYLKKRSWEELEISAFGRDLTAYLRRHVSDTTIPTYIGVLNRFMRQAEIDGFTTRNQITGKPALKQSTGNDGYAVATQDMITNLLAHSKIRMNEATRKDTMRTYTQAYSILRILADTGIRPFFNVPLNWNDISYDGDMVIIDRKEKGKRYNAQGGAITRQALDDLRKLYLSEGTNVKQHDNLPILHHSPVRNKCGEKVIEPLTQIERFTLTLGKLMKECGWYDKKDKEGRIYRCHSIRKWHINTSIDNDEDRFQIADRVGHTYAVLEKFYLNRGRKQNQKADIWHLGNKDMRTSTTE